MTGRTLMLVLVVGAVIGGCGDDTPVLDADELAVAVVGAVSFDVGHPVTDVMCPEVGSAGEPFTIECRATVGGADTLLLVSLVDADTGAITVENMEALVDVADLEADITSQLRVELGEEVEADCGDNPLRAAPFGGTFDCRVSSAGGEGRVIAEVGSEGAEVTWRLDE